MPLAFVLSHLLVVAFMTASAYALGRWLLKRLSFHSSWEELSISTAIGLGAIGTMILLLGLCGLLYRSSVLALFLACHGLGWTSWRSAIHRLGAVRWRARVGARWTLVSLTALGVLMPLAWRALYPPTQFDAIMYHLPAAKAFALSHRVSPLPWVRYVVFPQLNEMLFTAAMLLSDDLTAQLVELLFFVLVCVAMMAWARRFGALQTGLFGLALWIGSPMVLFLATSAYVEMAVAAFATMAVYAFFCWLQTNHRDWLLVAGLSAGFAAGTKYTGLFFVAAIFVAILLRRLRHPEWRAAFSFAASAAATAGLWYARNMICARSPLWPFLGEIFGHRFWTAGDVASQVWSLRTIGWPRTVASFFALPWNLAIHPPAGETPILRILFLLLPLSLIAAVWDPKARWLGGLTLGYLLFWFLTTQQLRFLVPILPVLSLMTANAVERLIARLPNPLRWPEWVSCMAALILLTAPVLATQYAWMKAEATPPRTQRERDTFLAARFSSYRCYSELNARLQTHYTIYAFHDEHMKYYAEGTQLGDFFGLGRYSDVALDSSRGLLESLERLGADFLLVNEESSPPKLPKDPEFDSRFLQICQDGPVTVFQIRH